MSDALNSSGIVTDAILKAGADYLMPIKQNGNKELCSHMEGIFNRNSKQSLKTSSVYKDHGRIDEYYYEALSGELIDTRIKNSHKSLNTLVKYTHVSTPVINGNTKDCTSSVRYYVSSLPFADDVIMLYENDESSSDGEKILPYDRFSSALKNSNLNYFDAIKYIDEHRESIIGGKVPLFYNSSHHWSLYKANLIGLALHEHMRKTMDIKLPRMAVTASPSDVAIYPDADLFNVLNIYDKPNEQFYESIIDYKDFDNDNLNFAIQGGSFLGGLLLPQSTISVLGKVYHIENKNFLYNNYKDHYEFETYDELNDKFDLLKCLRDTDVFILEINELNVYNATFGFLDYLLAHEEEI